MLKSYYQGHPGVDNQNKAQQIEFNMWAPRADAHDVDWSAGRDDSTMPWYAKVDWIEYHAWDPNTDTFNFQWRDDFDSFDYSKWAIANNFGFDQNLSTYMNTQVYTQDGQLVVKLEKNPQSANHMYNPWGNFL